MFDQLVEEALNKYVKVKRVISPADHLELDLGIDSLGRVELMVMLEQTLNVTIPDEAMAKASTVKELILEIERLVPGEGAREEPVPEVKDRAIWNEILNEKPAKDVIKKINLAPNRMTIFGMLLFVIVKQRVGMILLKMKSNLVV